MGRSCSGVDPYRKSVWVNALFGDQAKYQYLLPSSWVQVTDELLKAQQAAYAVQGVDEEVFPVSYV